MDIKEIEYENLTESHRQDITKLMNALSGRSINIKRALNSDNNTCIAAFENGKMVGILTLIEVNGFTLKFGLIDEVVVSPTYRGLGIASAILKETIKIAKEKNIDLLKVDTSINNPSNGLYQKVGFKKRNDNLYKLFL